MKKKETEIATNVSSGAEKVEVVEKEIKKTRGDDAKARVKTVKSAKGGAALGDSVKSSGKVSAKKMNSESGNSRAIKESEAAKARVELAIKKKEEKAKRKEEKLKKRAEKIEAYKKYVAEENAKIEKRLAEKKAKAEKHAAERKAIAEKRAAEKEKAVRERAHAKANKNEAHARKKKEKASRQEKGDKKRESRAKGYGGWIAAVVTLGVTTLALAATVTVGALEMNEMRTGMTGAQMGTMYELTGLMEHVDDDLDRVRISVSPTQQSRILTDLLVQARLAEADLEKLPVSLEKDRNITEFINRTAMESERMLSKLRAGQALTQEDLATLESLYKTNHSIREELDKLAEELTDKDLMEYIKDGAGMMSEALDRLESLTLEENRAALEGKMEKGKGAGMERVAPKAEEKDQSAIDATKAETLCKEYFSKYSIDEYQCVGETVTRNYSAYNVQGFDDNGSMLFAEIDRKTGDLITFDYYEEGSAENFDLDNARRIAEEFLEALGYEDMSVARFSESGSTSDFTFVYEIDGVAYYPDTVRVKVCRTRGLVCGLDATKYLKNHRGRDELSAKISMETAYEKLSDKLSVEASRLAVVDTARGERAAYEFLCSYEDANYFVYLDANTGEEIAILNAQNIR